MPLHLSIGITKKLGLPGYSSVGASCHVELELESTLMQQEPEAFQRHVRHAYLACAQAVNEELVRQKAPLENRPGPQPRTATPGPDPHVSEKPVTGNGAVAHGASERQLEYCHQLADQIQGLGSRGLRQFCQQMFGKPLSELSSLDASGLIDALKAVKVGDAPLPTALPGDMVAA